MYIAWTLYATDSYFCKLIKREGWDCNEPTEAETESFEYTSQVSNTLVILSWKTNLSDDCDIQQEIRCMFTNILTHKFANCSASVGLLSEV